MDLDQQIDDLGAADELSALVRTAAVERSIETAREAGYVSLRPEGGHIAAYVNKQFVDIAAAPSVAQGVAARSGASRVLAKTTATSYVRVPAGEGFDGDAVLQEVLAAIDWRAHGPTWADRSQRTSASDLAGEVCATCFLAIAVNGTCGCD